MYKRWVAWGSVCIVVIALLGTVQLPTSEDITFGKRLLQNIGVLREGANKRGNSSRLTQSFHFFMFKPIF
ncbi:hypothetical protein AB7225_06695, partial [Escherichia coli]